MSANSAVTVFRSPSSADVSVCSTSTRAACTDCLAVDGDASDAAHSSQNLAPGLLAAPQWGHLAAKGVAHSRQNFAPSRLSAPHFVQHIATASPQADGRVSRLDGPIERRELLRMRNLGTLSCAGFVRVLAYTGDKTCKPPRLKCVKVV